MRWTVSFALIAACIATAAVAQATAPSIEPNGKMTPVWDRRPNAQDFARNYPEPALEAGISGMVILCCTPRDDRRLDCTNALEWPRGHGFGEAALNIAEDFRLNEESAALYHASENAWLQVPIRMMAIGSEQQFTPHFERIRDATQTLCMPVANSSPAN